MDRLHAQTDGPQLHEAENQVPYEEPSGAMEMALAGVWQDALRVSRIGRNSNFFELGGNSLLAMNLTEMLADRLSIKVSVVTLFQYPTIRELSEVIEAS